MIFQMNFISPRPTNHFDTTCHYMLQLATIISMVKPWKTRATLRVVRLFDPNAAEVNDAYIRGVNELLREQCDKTSCLYLYLPRPPDDKSRSQAYIRVLDMLSTDLPPILFVHGVSFVTCTHL